MTVENTEHGSNNQREAGSLDAYVVLYDNEHGETCMLGELLEERHVPVYFLSPLDALIDASFLAGSDGGASYRIKPVSEIDMAAFCGSQSGTIAAFFHLAWAVREGRFVRREGRIPARVGLPLRQEAGGPAAVRVSDTAFFGYWILRERAGLFAWTEALADIVETWNTKRLSAVLERAMTSAQPTEGAHVDCTHLALFDPETERWLLVPNDWDDIAKALFAGGRA
jgi:hypothetical protein